MMAKIRGVQRWQHKDPMIELIALEIELDSMSQKIPRMLGRVRSVLGKSGHKQKTLKRWTKPAPNQILDTKKKESSKQIASKSKAHK